MSALVDSLIIGCYLPIASFNLGPCGAAVLGIFTIPSLKWPHYGLGCAPALDPPPLSLVRLAGKYGIPVRH